MNESYTTGGGATGPKEKKLEGDVVCNRSITRTKYDVMLNLEFRSSIAI